MKEPKKQLGMEAFQGRLAARAVRLIDLLAKNLELPSIEHDKAAKRRKIATSHVPPALIYQMAATVDQHGRLVGVRFDKDRVRELMTFASVFEPVAHVAEVFAARVRQAVVDAKSEAGAATLTAYTTMKGVVRHEDGAVLRNDLAKMKRIMKERRNAHGQAKTAPAPEPTPAPQQPPPQPYVVAVPSHAQPVERIAGEGARLMLQLPGWKDG